MNIKRQRRISNVEQGMSNRRRENLQAVVFYPDRYSAFLVRYFLFKTRPKGDKFMSRTSLIGGLNLPRVFPRVSHHFCSDRIEFDVPINFKQITFLLNQTGFKSTFTQCSTATILKIKILNIPAAK